MTRCLNCGSERKGDECPSCGLTSSIAELVFRPRFMKRTAVVLAEGILRGVMLKKLGIWCAILIAVGGMTLAGGLALLAEKSAPVAQNLQLPNGQDAAPAPVVKAPESRLDPNGDPAVPITVSLALGAAVLWMLLGVFNGVISAIHPRSLADRSLTLFSLFFYSFPSFLLGLLLLYFLYFRLTLAGIDDARDRLVHGGGIDDLVRDKTTRRA